MARPSSPNLKVLDFELGLSQNLPNICWGQTLSSEPLKDSKLMMFLLEDSSGKGELHLRFFLGVQFSWFMPSGSRGVQGPVHERRGRETFDHGSLNFEFKTFGNSKLVLLLLGVMGFRPHGSLL